MMLMDLKAFNQRMMHEPQPSLLTQSPKTPNKTHMYENSNNINRKVKFLIFLKSSFYYGVRTMKKIVY